MKAEFGSDPAEVYTAYHAVNSRIKYKVTVNREALETAFMSEAMLLHWLAILNDIQSLPNFCASWFSAW